MRWNYFLKNIILKILFSIIIVYQKFLSPFLGKNCRYYPTCSEYFKISLIKHGIFYGTYKTAIRLLKCNPLFEGGIDHP